jgi:ketosteroid isomerase-like protein
MTKRSSRRALALLLASSFLAALATPLPADEPAGAAAPPSVALPPELDRVLRDYETAWSAGDEAALAALFAEDGFVMPSGRMPARGREAIRETYAEAGGGPLHLRAFAFATDGDVGYILGGYSGAPGAPDDGKFVLALARDAAGRWLIAADIDNGNSRRPPGPAPAPAPTPQPSPGATRPGG